MAKKIFLLALATTSLPAFEFQNDLVSDGLKGKIKSYECMDYKADDNGNRKSGRFISFFDPVNRLRPNLDALSSYEYKDGKIVAETIEETFYKGDGIGNVATKINITQIKYDENEHPISITKDGEEEIIQNKIDDTKNLKKPAITIKTASLKK